MSKNSDSNLIRPVFENFTVLALDSSANEDTDISMKGEEDE
jgi:hypothetical protein